MQKFKKSLTYTHPIKNPRDDVITISNQIHDPMKQHSCY